MSKGSQTMAAHTPGPWQLIYRDIGGPFLESVAGPDGQKIRLIGVALAMNSRETDPEPEANARLIAAAPDMLAALREYVAADDETQRTVGGDRDENDRAINRLIDAREQAIKAIAKSEGR